MIASLCFTLPFVIAAVIWCHRLFYPWAWR